MAKKGLESQKQPSTYTNAMKSALAASRAAFEQEDVDSDREEEHEGDLAAFQQLDPSIQLSDPDADACRKTFQNCVFLVGRETAFEPISFVIRCGGGVAIYETAITQEQSQSALITHQIVDRPGQLQTKLMGRSYVQPQWVFDSFNMRCKLPVQPYSPGQSLPPHLSPFVDDEKEGYVPDQRNQLRQWVGMAPLKQSSLERIKKSDEKKQYLAEHRDEYEYQQQLKKEQLEAKLAKAAAKREQNQANRKAILEKSAKNNTFAKSAPSAMDMGDDEEEVALDMGMDFGGSDVEMGDDDDDDDSEGAEIDVEDVSDADFDEETYMASDDDGDDDEEARIAAKPKAVARPREINKDEREMSKFLMNRKDSRLHSRMMFGKNRTSEHAQRLVKKKVAAEQGVENPTLPKRTFNGNRRR